MPTPFVPRTRYAIVGTGGRSAMYSHALLGTYRDRHDLVALCDSNPGRMAFYNREFAETFKAGPLPSYTPDGFECMLREQRVETVIVTTPDCSHHEYIIRAMDAGCDVIVEKPMTTDEVKCRAVRAAIRRTGRRLRAIFNARYIPQTALMKQLLMDGTIGDITSVHFEWNLDTSHGADYFRRWHRDMANSGGLMVHKASHHFDLVNWWLGSQPETVFGFGDLRFYGRKNGEVRGDYRPYRHATDDPAAIGDPFALQLTGRERDMYHDTSAHDGYHRDQNVFGDGITIHDDMAVLVRYRNRTTLSYHLSAYAPWEGWRCMFNGSRGRLEAVCEHNAYADGATEAAGAPAGHAPVDAVRSLVVRPLHQRPYRLEVPVASGTHGGSDDRLLDDMFIGGQDDPLGQAAGYEDGMWGIATGISANRSFATGREVRVDELFAEAGRA